MRKPWKLLLGAVPPLVSQLTFSIVSFFVMAGLARQFSSREFVSVIAAYSIQSVAVGWGNARWATLLVYRESAEPRRGDVHMMAVRFLGTSLLGFPFFFLAAFLVERDWTTAILAAVWADAMLFGDLWRFAGSRFLSSFQVSMIGLAYLLFSLPVTFLFGGLRAYLLTLAAFAILQGLAYWAVLWSGRPAGISKVWTRDVLFARSVSSEALVMTLAIGLGGVGVSWLNPTLAVGLQLGNQLLSMPAMVLVSALALPLTRRLREALDNGRYPVRFLLQWVALAIVVPVFGVALLLAVRPVVGALMGTQSEHAYFFLPISLLGALIVLTWQPVTAARRWVVNPVSTRNHVAMTMTAYYAGIVGLTALVREPDTLRVCLIALGSATLISTVSRMIRWLRHGRAWESNFQIEPREEAQA